MRRTSGNPSTLSDSVQRHLNAYALAASAAGVSVLALAQSSEAKIVYTRTHHVIRRNSQFYLNLNHEGHWDFGFLATAGCSSYGACTTELTLYGAPSSTLGNAAIGMARWPYYAYALKAGAPINAAQRFGGWVLFLRAHSKSSAGRCRGSWTSVRNRYLGFKFLIRQQTHYGWARLSANCKLHSRISGVLTGYAYETIPRKAIIAGKTKGPDVITVEPGSLGALAAGRRGRSH